MTTTVKVEAHCTPDRCVQIQRFDGKDAEPTAEIYIDNGEKWEGVVYGSQTVSVTEVEK